MGGNTITWWLNSSHLKNMRSCQIGAWNPMLWREQKSTPQGDCTNSRGVIFFSYHPCEPSKKKHPVAEGEFTWICLRWHSVVTCWWHDYFDDIPLLRFAWPWSWPEHIRTQMVVMCLMVMNPTHWKPYYCQTVNHFQTRTFGGKSWQTSLVFP